MSWGTGERIDRRVFKITICIKAGICISNKKPRFKHYVWQRLIRQWLLCLKCGRQRGAPLVPIAFLKDFFLFLTEWYSFFLLWACFFFSSFRPLRAGSNLNTISHWWGITDILSTHPHVNFLAYNYDVENGHRSSLKGSAVYPLSKVRGVPHLPLTPPAFLPPLHSLCLEA